METMSALKTKTTLTAVDFYHLPDHGGHCELVKGKVVPIPPTGAAHGKIAMRIGALLWRYVEKHNLGEVYAAETGFTIEEDPDTVRAPDAAFVSRDRIPPEGEPPGFWHSAPDLVVEVVSPFDQIGDVQAKITEYLQAGVRLVWLVEPQTRTVTVYKSLDVVRILLQQDTLDGGEILPGFTLPLADLFR